MAILSHKKDIISIPDLPEDVFLLVLESLNAWDVVRCQKVSRAWREVFIGTEHLRRCLKRYPRTREATWLQEIEDKTEGEHENNVDIDIQLLVGSVASRYYHMSVGKARHIVKHKLNPLEQFGSWYPIGQWDYHESQPGGRLYHENAAAHLTRLGNKPYLFRSTLWSYDDGLVACALVHGSDHTNRPYHILSILDLATNKSYTVPFRCPGRVIRNITLRNRALVIEWAEKEPYHDLNDNEKVHRHFATCYDVLPGAAATSSDEAGSVAWQIILRNEWKMHFLGLPMNNRDRFFSIHNGVHYAVYFWQPNRSMYTGDEDMPIEALFVWDIATPSSYLPSTDPARRSVPREDERPHMLARYSFRELDFIGVRQHANISFLSMALDSVTFSLTIRENFCLAGQGYFDPAERPMQSIVTTFPFLGEGPALRREWDGDWPPYRGHCSMESDNLEVIERWFSPVMEVADPVTGVRLSLVETCFTGQSVENKLVVRVRRVLSDTDDDVHGGKWVSLDDAIVREVAGMGRVAGDERWIIGQNRHMELVVVKF